MTPVGIQRVLLSATLGAVMTMTADAARAAEQSTEPTTLSLGEASAPPGAPVVAPLALAAPEGVLVGAVDVRLTYPKALLTFVKMEPSGLALGVGAALQVDVAEGPDASSSTLHASISTTAVGGSRKPLPSGPLAYLAFTIAQSAKPQTSIALAHTATALTIENPPTPIKPLVAAKAQVGVADPPVPACFFYMH